MMAMKPTVSASVLPLLLRVPYIDKGYRRPHQSLSYYLRSVFQLHNESINIWTHTLAVLVVALKMLSVNSKHDLLTDPYMRPLLTLMISVVILYVSSSLAHCFHSRSEIDHYTCFMFDYCGIGIYCFCGPAASHFYSGEDSMYAAFKSSYVVISVVLGLAVSVSFIAALVKVPANFLIAQLFLKMVPVSLAGLWTVLPMYHRIEIYMRTGNCSVCLNNHVQLCVWTCLAAVFYVSKIPERVFLGWCDFVGTGHQCFHVLIMMGSFNLVDGMICDVDNRSYDIHLRDEPTVGETLGILGMLGIVNLVLILVFRRNLKRVIQNQKDSYSK